MFKTLQLSSLRAQRALKCFVILFAAASALTLADSAYAQRSRGNRGTNAQSRQERGGERPGRDMSEGDRQWGPGQEGQDQGQFPQEGQDQGQQAQDGQNGKQDQTPQVPLDESLKAAKAATPIQLNYPEFTTMDGVRLQGVYYKGAGTTDAPVVIILRDLNGKRENWDSIAQNLSQMGIAVLIPEYRSPSAGLDGRQRGPRDNNPPNDRPQVQQQAQQLSMEDIMGIIEYDRLVWFNFLAYVHNLEMCNMKKTIVVGSGFGAALAASWAKDDWTNKEKISQNVCGLVLLSPDVENDMEAKKYNALSSLEALRKRAKFPNVGALIFVGELNKEKFEAAKEIQQAFGGKVVDESTPMEERACPLVAIKTDQQADNLLKFESFGVPATLAQYVQLRTSKLPKKRAKWEKIEEKKSRR